MDIEYPDSCKPFFNGVHGIHDVVNHYWGGGVGGIRISSIFADRRT